MKEERAKKNNEIREKRKKRGINTDRIKKRERKK